MKAYCSLITNLLFQYYSFFFWLQNSNIAMNDIFLKSIVMNGKYSINACCVMYIVQHKVALGLKRLIHVLARYILGSCNRCPKLVIKATQIKACPQISLATRFWRPQAKFVVVTHLLIYTFITEYFRKYTQRHTLSLYSRLVNSQ